MSLLVGAVIVVAGVLGSGGSRPLVIVVGLGAAGVLAARRRANAALLRERVEQDARRRIEQERLRIARGLHDVVAHTLTAITVQAATAAYLLDERPDQARTALDTIEETSRDAITALRA